MEWNGIRLEVTFEPEWLPPHILGEDLAHLQVRSIDPEDAPLPITQTGYRSHFIAASALAAAGGPSDSPASREREKERRQLALFEDKLLESHEATLENKKYLESCIVLVYGGANQFGEHRDGPKTNRFKKCRPIIHATRLREFSARGLPQPGKDRAAEQGVASMDGPGCG